MKMDKGVNHIHVSFIVGDKAISVHKAQLLKKKENRSGLEPQSLYILAEQLTTLH